MICKHYYNNLSKASSDFEDFITFEYNSNYYFAWVHEGKVILRSEAYPDYDRVVKGIKAIINNKDIEDRYSIDSRYGVHFLCLWGGGKNNKHTGNMAQHNEIGRSCPAKTKAELYDLVRFKGSKFASSVTGYSMDRLASSGVGIVPAVEPMNKKIIANSIKSGSATTSSKVALVKSPESNDSGGFKWWWALLLLLIPVLFFIKGCDRDTSKDKRSLEVNEDKNTTSAEVKLESEIKTNIEKSETEINISKIEAKADTEINVRAKEIAKKNQLEVKAKSDTATAAAKVKSDAERKARTGGSVTQESIKIGNKNSEF